MLILILIKNQLWTILFIYSWIISLSLFIEEKRLLQCHISIISVNRFKTAIYIITVYYTVVGIISGSPEFRVRIPPNPTTEPCDIEICYFLIYDFFISLKIIKNLNYISINNYIK